MRTRAHTLEASSVVTACFFRARPNFEWSCHCASARGVAHMALIRMWPDDQIYHFATVVSEMGGAGFCA